MNSVAIPFQNHGGYGSASTQLLNTLLHHARLLQREACELAHLIRMRMHREAASEHAGSPADCLLSLRAKSRHMRLQEAKAKSHWFNRVLPTYEAPVNLQYMPVATYTDELKIMGDRHITKENRLAEMNDLYTVRMLLGTTKKMVTV